ncbi:MAG: hypothetical protein HY899_15620 [Deltaproteobacteria bacterium]|nr:hypothetical protein [Deltaproteobacteria bacterium]
MRTAPLGLALILAGAPETMLAGEVEPPSVAVVVNHDSTLRSLDAEVLRDLYLRRRVLIADGSRVVPVNLPADDPLRLRFSQLVLGRRPAELSGYWDRLYYEGVRPPIVLPSAEAIRRYLHADLRAIGYLAEEEVDSSLRVIAVFPPHGSSPAATSSR